MKQGASAEGDEVFTSQLLPQPMVLGYLTGNVSVVLFANVSAKEKMTHAFLRRKRSSRRTAAGSKSMRTCSVFLRTPRFSVLWCAACVVGRLLDPSLTKAVPSNGAWDLPRRAACSSSRGASTVRIASPAIQTGTPGDRGGGGALLTHKRRPPQPAQPRYTNDWALRTRKRHQQEHTPTLAMPCLALARRAKVSERARACVWRKVLHRNRALTPNAIQTKTSYERRKVR